MYNFKYYVYEEKIHKQGYSSISRIHRNVPYYECGIIIFNNRIHHRGQITSYIAYNSIKRINNEEYACNYNFSGQRLIIIRRENCPIIKINIDDLSLFMQFY